MENPFPDIIADPVHETTCVKCGHLMDVSNLPVFIQIVCPECGTQQRVPGKMGSFLLVDLLGKGGMGAVYRGRDTGLDRWVAVKVMQSTFGVNPEFVETFRREAQAAAALNHPNIVQIYSFGVAHGQPFMVMELLEGGRLDQMIARGEMLNEALIVKIGVDVAEGLNAAATINLIHGDVKPENILLDTNGVAKVVDFGLARFKESSEGGPSKGIWGTPYYIAPEKLRGHQADVRSDIYSLGGTLFHALTLKPPFDGETPMDVVKARLKQAAPTLRSVRPELSHEVEAIVSRMLDVEPTRRYPNYASALSDLRRVLSTLSPPPPAAYGAVSKKGGKIILSKKKGGVTPPTSSQNLSSRSSSGKLDEAVSSRAGGRQAAKVMKALGWTVLGLGVLAGLAVGGYGYYRANQDKLAREKEGKLLARHRSTVAGIESELQFVVADLSNRVGVAQAWASNAVGSEAAITHDLSQLPEPGEFSGAASNVASEIAVVEQYRGGSLAPALTELRGMLELVATNRLALQGMTNSAPAALRLAALTNLVVRAQDLKTALSVPEEKSRKAVEVLETLRQKVAAALKAYRTAEEKVAAEKAAAEQAAAEKAAAEQAELKLIEESRKANVVLLQQHQFKIVVETLDRLVKDLKTDTGKAAGRQVVAAYQKLVELKTAFIEGIRAEVKADPEKGYSYGWLKSTDILNASEEKLTLRGGQTVLWNAVPPREMILLYQHYVENGELTRREKAQHDFAMALYVYDTMSGIETARKQAARYLAEAIKGQSALDELAKVVMPDSETK